MLVSSCLTPDFVFDQESASGDGDGDLGGSSGDGDASCTDGRKSGTETDEDCGGSCGPCAEDQRCELDEDCQSFKCSAGKCAAASCADRIQNGSEADIDCGGECEGCEPGQICIINDDCLAPPIGDPATSSCQEGSCVLTCAGGTADCNGRADDGCETNLNTDLNHCGACGSLCDPDHATAAKCQGGECLIDFDAGGCAGAWLDCNGDPEDGCETDTNDDTNNCGDCDAACSDNHGSPACDNGTCVSTCDLGYADCDDDVWSNGCEANTAASVATCGGCGPGNACPEGSSTESPFCDMGMCGLSDCPSGQGDCDGDTMCTDDLTDEASCGSCGNSCVATNATTSCEDQGSSVYACEISGCLDSGGADYEDCDGLYANGCETNVLVSKDDCGGCAPGTGTNCSALQGDSSKHINSITCADGDCVITGCSTGYSDCDSDSANGCEVHIATNPDRCGGCLPSDPKMGTGLDCSSQPNTTGQCINYSCEIDQCALSFGTGCPRNVTKNVDGSPSVAGQVEVTYNSTNLVVTVVATDADIRPHEGGESPWDADGIEIYIDVNNSKGTSFDTNDYQIIVPLGGAVAVSSPGGNPAGAINVNATYASSPYTVAVTIPWAALNTTVPSVGSVLGFDVGINDDDGGGTRDGQVMLFGTNQNFNNPSLWGTLRIN